MKIRLGFVSNSSSSSFTCEVCGNTESGYDMGRSEAGFVVCENGHELCENCAGEYSITDLKEILLKDGVLYDDTPEKREFIKECDDIDELKEEFCDEINDEGIPACACPLCSLKTVDDNLLIHYLLIKLKETYNSIVNEIKDRFKTEKDLKKFIRENK